MADLASGTDSADFIIIGDSNVGSALFDFWGYFSGLSETLLQRGYTNYGATIAPAMNGRNVNNAPGLWRSAINLFAPTGALQSGNTSGGSSPYAGWSPNGNFTRYGSSSSTPDSRDDWAYLATGSAQYFQTFGYEINSNHPLAATGQEVFFRIRYGTSSSTGGGFAPMVFNGSSAEQFSPRVFQTSLGEAYSYTAFEKSWVTSGTTSYRATWSFVGTGSDVCKGPLAVHSVSMYRKVKGWSVHSHSYLGGFSSDAIATVISNNVDRIKLLLQEIRERQMLAGGSGRVVVMYQFGVNATTTSQPETPTKWVQAAKDIWSAYKTAWASLGYPESDLATVGWVSHQINAQDNSSLGTGGNLAAVRTAANQMAIDNPDMTVVDIKRLFNYNQLLMGTGEIGATGIPALSAVGKPYYQRISTWPNAGTEFYQHLSGGLIGSTTWHPTDGYTAMMNGLVSALLASA